MDNSKAKAEDVTCNINFDKEIALKLFNDESMLWSRDFRPSTSIAHAMEVEAKMFRRGFRMKTQRFQDGRINVTFVDENNIFSGGATGYHNYEENICRAALAALEGI